MLSSPSRSLRIFIPPAELSLRARIAQVAFRLSPCVNKSQKMATTTKFEQVCLFVYERAQYTHWIRARRNPTSWYKTPMHLLRFLTDDRTGCSSSRVRSKFTMKCTSPNLQPSESRSFTLSLQFICQCAPFYVACRRRLYTRFRRLHSDVPVSGPPFELIARDQRPYTANYCRPRTVNHSSLPAQELWAGTRYGSGTSRRKIFTLDRSLPIS
jgi:hypothetical protein